MRTSKQPVLKSGNPVWLNLIIIVGAILLTVGAVVYFDSPPNPKAPQCSAREVAFFARDGWWCVAGRKP